ncbi:MAG TPA: ATP-binding protein [Patescibacteria group bacterium]|nr:ATP-binding protein [Patescibacteria group bacterium]
MGLRPPARQAPIRTLLTTYRNYLFLLLVILASFGMIAGFLLTGARQIDTAILGVEHAETAMRKNQDFGLRVEQMIAAARGYALTANRKFAADYTQAKAEVSDTLADIDRLMAALPGLSPSRLEELHDYFLKYTTSLDAQFAAPGKKSGIIAAENLRGDLARVNRDILLESQKLLGDQRTGLAELRRRAIERILICCIAMAVLFMVINAWYLRARMARDRAERELADSEQAFRLAIEGSSDGFFEWNFQRDRAFYSKQYLAMLGYDDLPVQGALASFGDLIHPEDKERVLGLIEQYRAGETGEYLGVFRLRHRTGRWIWVNARGRAVYDSAGHAYRIVGAHTDITHIKAYEEKLERAKERAEKANRAKTEFLAHMSHEIRTPLTAISGIAEIFENTQAGLDSRQRQLVRTLSSSTASLKDLINDILDFSKIESGELELAEKAFDLQALFEQVVSIFSVKASEKGIRFTFDYNAVRGLQMLGDPVRLRQILINLIGNAIKFTQEGRVAVTARRIGDGNDEQLRLDVQDSGIGISPENFSLIFERFKQADSSVSRKYGGTGLGLPISLRLARLMGGDITVDSKPKEGALFTVTLPLRLAEPQPLQDEDDGDIEPGRPADIRQKRVLIVDDYEGNIVILSYLLDTLKCPYDVARTGKEAVDKWAETPFDLILMDVQMPEMDGFTATQEIRRIETQTNRPRTPIMGMTAHAFIGDKEQCLKAGMDTYLPKPVVEADLRAKIYELLAGKSA